MRRNEREWCEHKNNVKNNANSKIAESSLDSKIVESCVKHYAILLFKNK